MVLWRKRVAGEEGLVVVINQARLIIVEFDDGFDLRSKTIFVEGIFFAGVFGKVVSADIVITETDEHFVHLRSDGGKVFAVGVHGEDVFASRGAAQDGFSLKF